MPSNPYSAQICSTESTKRRVSSAVFSEKSWPPPPSENHHLLPLTLFQPDVGLELLRREVAVHSILHPALARVVVRRGERHQNNVPLRRHVADGAVAGPVADELVAVGAAGHRDRRHGVGRGARRRAEWAAASAPSRRRRLRGRRQGRGVGEAVAAVERGRRGRPVVPLQQRDVLQVKRHAAERRHERRRRLDRVLPVHVSRVVAAAGNPAAAGAAVLPRQFLAGVGCRHLHPRRKRVAGCRRAPRPAVERVVQRIAEEPRQLLGDRLHIRIRVGRVRIQKGAEHEWLSRSSGRVDAVRAPMAALGGVGVDVVRRVARDGQDEAARRHGLLRQPREHLLLHEAQVDHGEAPARLLRRQHVTHADRHVDLQRHDLGRAEPRVPVALAAAVPEVRAHERIGVLRGAGSERIAREDRRVDDPRGDGAGIQHGPSARRVHRCFDRQRNRNEDGGNRRRSALGRVCAEQRVRVVGPCNACRRRERRQRYRLGGKRSG